MDQLPLLLQALSELRMTEIFHLYLQKNPNANHQRECNMSKPLPQASHTLLLLSLLGPGHLSKQQNTSTVTLIKPIWSLCKQELQSDRLRAEH
jgi:hypothetical protein